MILKWILKVGIMGMDWIRVSQNKAKWEVGLVLTCPVEKATLNRLM
jgi:hypothetical protein